MIRTLEFIAFAGGLYAAFRGLDLGLRPRTAQGTAAPCHRPRTARRRGTAHPGRGRAVRVDQGRLGVHR